MTTPNVDLQRAAAAQGIDLTLADEQQALRALLSQGIPYTSVLSIRDHPEIRSEYRTDVDAQAILDGIVPLVQGLLDEQRDAIVDLLERRARWAANAAGRTIMWPIGWSRRERSNHLRELATKADAYAGFADVLRAQKRRWWV